MRVTRASRNPSSLLFLTVFLAAGVAAAAPPTDLEIDSFTVAVDNTTVTFTARVCNASTKTSAAASAAGLYYDRSGAPTCSTATSATWQIPALGPGQCHEASHSRSGTPLGVYRAWVMADHSCSIKESLEDNNTASEAYAVVNALTITAFTAVASGSDVSYSITARNGGIDVGAPFVLALYFDRDSAPACGDTPDHSWSLPALLGGAEVTQVLPRAAVPIGAYRAWAFVDQSCVVDEEDEADNSAEAEYVVGPNLRLRQARAQAAGTTVSYTVTVCNDGSLAVAGAEVALWYDRSAAASCSSGGPDHTWAVGALAPGDCASLTHTRNNAAAGSYTARFLADPGCALTEATEDDNHASAPHTVQGPDLWIQQLTPQLVGRQVTLVADVCNSGTGPASAFEVAFFFDRASAPDCQSAPDAVEAIAALATQGCAQVSAVLPAAGIGGKSGWVLADRECTIAEDDETNNTASAQYTVVPRPDLLITELTADVDGSTVRFFATVCNADADAEAPASSSGLYLDRSAAPPADCSEAPDAVEPLDPVPPGGCLNQTWTRPVVPPGQYTAYALADAPCGLEEEDEANNTASVSYEVTAPLPDGGVPDAGVPDGGPSAADGAPAADTGSPPRSDAARADATTGRPPVEDGCGCAVDARPAGAIWLVLPLLLIALRPAARRAARRGSGARGA